MTEKQDSEVSEEVLVRRSKEGDKAAFRELVERYQSRLFSLAFGVLKSKEDAEDVTQETFVKAYLSLANFEGKSTFYTWIYRIGFNMSVDFKRKVKRRGGSHVEVADIPGQNQGQGQGHSHSAVESVADPSTPHVELLKKEQRHRIGEAMARLSDEHRTVVTLREIDGLSYDEISEALGISKGTVMSRLHYARKKLQEVLRDVAPDGAEHSAVEPEISGSALSLGLSVK